MLKKILIGLGILALILVAAFFYLDHRNRTLSPPGEIEFAQNDFEMVVQYSRPSVRGRLIFGTEEAGALQPYGQYWRLGANEVTTLEINKDVLFNGEPLLAGKYALYAIPGPDQFTIGVNSETSRWGYSEPNYEKDLFTTEANLNKLEIPSEQVTAKIEPADYNGVTLYFDFSDVEIVIPIEIQ